MGIKIDNNFGDFEAFLISPKGRNLGKITNIISLDNVRRQIRDKKVSGYKIRFQNRLIGIDKNGILEELPDEFCYYTKMLIDFLN